MAGMKVDPRFLTEEGPEIFTGNELLVKGALETAGGVHLLGGYPGSPVAGFFDTLVRIKDLLKARGVRAIINNNEALAAAALNGSQSVKARAMIVMKSVGVHVAADALALGNLAGADREGGAVVVYGDDPWSDSTQVPADSRYISKHLHIPVIEPATNQEVKDYVGLAFELSRRAELFAGLLLSTNLADGGGSVQCRPNQFPRFGTAEKIDLETASIDLDRRVLLPPRTWWQEESLAERFERAKRAALDLGLNRIEYPSDGSRKPVGFVTSGLAHAYLVQALLELGELGDSPILKFGLSYPVDAEMVRRLAGQCERIVVVEERRGFLEEQIGEMILYDRQRGLPSGQVELWGKRFPDGGVGLPSTRGLHPSIIIERLVRLSQQIGGSLVRAPADPVADSLSREMEQIDATGRVDVGELVARVPSFCPGCPHRDSASLCIQIKKRFADAEYMQRVHHRGPVDLLFHGDIGCYTMLMYPPNAELMHDLSGMGLGGGTNAGIDPFTVNKKVVFMGDSTFFHSGALAISQAIKLGQDITFIILDNATTAMTGHQTTPGVDYDVLGDPTATQDIEEVVRGIVGDSGSPVARVDPCRRKAYRKLLEATFLADGVKIVIADRECAITENRRKRRADGVTIRREGFLPTSEHLNINTDLCRFCLACSEITGCPGLRHVETDYGRKMDTDLSACVGEGTCARLGACNSFERITIKRKRPPRSRVPELGLDEIPEPQQATVGEVWRACLVGVGGMGVGLATSILVRAGHNEGYNVSFVDKKGLAIRNGGVVSQVVYNIAEKPITPLIPYGKADLLIGLDVLEAARSLDPMGRTRIASSDRTAAVINTDKVATILGLMGQEDFDPAQLEGIVRRNTNSDAYLARDLSRICEKYLGSKLYANVMMLGFAFQRGLIPVSMHSMAWAIKDTIRTAFRKNLYAFNMGRKLVMQPDLFQGPPQRTGWRETLEEKCRHTIRRFAGGQRLAAQLRQLAAETIETLGELDESVRRAVVIRIYDCIRWGGIDYAGRYAERLGEIFAKDKAEFGYAATRAVVYNLADAMLIKDAVYTAELATSPEKYARDREKYNVNPANGDCIRYRHVMNAKLRLGRWRFGGEVVVGDWLLKGLKRSRWLRKVMRWNRPERKFLATYERAIAEFAYADAEEYHRRLRALSSPRCMACLNPQCSERGCPLANAIAEWVALANEGRWREAYEKLVETNNFPEITCRICPAPCQDACKRALNGYPLQIRQIEASIVEHAEALGLPEARRPAERTGRSVAVVGSGPAGLAAAQQLARAGHDVTVFEKDPQIGGLLRYGIPDFRLPRDLLDRRAAQLQAEGVVFRTGTRVGTDVRGTELREQFDAVCLATGAARPRDLDIPGRQLDGVHLATEFLRRHNVGAGEGLSAEGKTVAVIGGGETGNDCVETALLQGATAVHQIEILPEDSFNGWGGAHENVRRHGSVMARTFAGDGRLGEIVASRVRWTRSANGPVMSEIPGSEFRLRADMALLALGFDPIVDDDLAEQFDLATDPRGAAIVTDCRTSAEGVFAAGDLVAGASLVAGAIDSGRRVARKIDTFLGKLPVADEARATDA